MRSSTSASLSASSSSSRADWSRAIAWPFSYVFLGGFTPKIHAVAPYLSAPRRRAQSLRPATPLPGTSPPQAALRKLPAPSPDLEVGPRTSPLPTQPSPHRAPRAPRGPGGDARGAARAPPSHPPPPPAAP